MRLSAREQAHGSLEGHGAAPHRAQLGASGLAMAGLADRAAGEVRDLVRTDDPRVRKAAESRFGLGEGEPAGRLRAGLARPGGFVHVR